MSEFKPKKDDSRAGDDAGSGKTKVGDSSKPHGDKLQHALYQRFFCTGSAASSTALPRRPCFAPFGMRQGCPR